MAGYLRRVTSGVSVGVITAIVTTMIVAGGVAVAAGAVPANSVNSSKIVDNTVQGVDIKDNTVRTGDIRDGTIGAVDLATPVINDLHNIVWVRAAANASTAALGSASSEVSSVTRVGVGIYRVTYDTPLMPASPLACATTVSIHSVNNSAPVLGLGSATTVTPIDASHVAVDVYTFSTTTGLAADISPSGNGFSLVLVC